MKSASIKGINGTERIVACYSVHCTVYTVQCTLYTVHCTLYTVHCTLYTVHCTLYTVQLCTVVYSQQYNDNYRDNGERIDLRFHPKSSDLHLQCGYKVVRITELWTNQRPFPRTHGPIRYPFLEPTDQSETLT